MSKFIEVFNLDSFVALSVFAVARYYNFLQHLPHRWADIRSYLPADTYENLASADNRLISQF
jgi:hypothetical protein